MVAMAASADMAVVKANAYGLGVSETVSTLEPLDPWGFGVASVGEGVELRELGVERPILVCSPVPPASYADALRFGLTLSVSDLGGLAALAAAVVFAGGTVLLQRPQRLRQHGLHHEGGAGGGNAGVDGTAAGTQDLFGRLGGQRVA